MLVIFFLREIINFHHTKQFLEHDIEVKNKKNLAEMRTVLKPRGKRGFVTLMEKLKFTPAST
jgi:hypothetical protein